MVSVILVLILVFGLSAYLNSGVRYGSVDLLANESSRNENFTSLSAIRFLTSKTSRVKKNYEKPPAELNSSLYNISSQVNADSVILYYQFPILDREKSILTLALEPESISYIVDQFGVESKYIEKLDSDLRFDLPSKPSELKKSIEGLLDGSFFLDQNGVMEIDYYKIIQDSLEFSKPIAHHITSELHRLNMDGYFERVQAVLNFVQFIPYGIPDFDHLDFYYLGVALPPESMVLNYSDCDSKSILFASILSHIIDNENIVLVRCNVSDGSKGGGKPESHMMVAVKGLGINEGQKLEVKGEVYQLLETTSPCSIGAWHWEHFDLTSVIELKNNF